MIRFKNFSLILIVVFLAPFSCTKDFCDDNTFELRTLGNSVDVPIDRVSMLFQVLDSKGKGVVGMTMKERYSLLDYNQEMMNSSEAAVQIESFGTIPTEIYTSILIDISASVSGLVGEIKSAASEFVNLSLPEQKISIITFDGDAPVQRIGFTTNKTQLLAAINSIPETNLGTSTNLYDALTYAASTIPPDNYTTSYIRQGSILVFTDGAETANPTSSGLSQATFALNGKSVFVAALKSNDLDEQTLKNFIATNPDNYFLANNIQELKAKFGEIQSDIEKLSKSVYWLFYTSPRKGPNYWDIRLTIKDNCNESLNAAAEGSYSSIGF